MSKEPKKHTMTKDTQSPITIPPQDKHENETQTTTPTLSHEKKESFDITPNEKQEHEVQTTTPSYTIESSKDSFDIKPPQLSIGGDRVNEVPKEEKENTLEHQPHIDIPKKGPTLSKHEDKPITIQGKKPTLSHEKKDSIEITPPLTIPPQNKDLGISNEKIKEENNLEKQKNESIYIDNTKKHDFQIVSPKPTFEKKPPVLSMSEGKSKEKPRVDPSMTTTHDEILSKEPKKDVVLSHEKKDFVDITPVDKPKKKPTLSHEESFTIEPPLKPKVEDKTLNEFTDLIKQLQDFAFSETPKPEPRPKDNLRELQEENTALKETIEKEHKKHEKMIEKLHQQEKTIQNMQNQEKTIQDLQKKLDDAYDQIQKLNDNLDITNDTNTSLSKELSEVKQKMSSLESELEEKKERVERYENENEGKLQIISIQDEELEDLSKEHEKNEKQIKELKKHAYGQLMESDDEEKGDDNERPKDEIRRITMERDQLRRQVQEMKKKEQSEQKLKKELEQITLERDQLKKEIQEMKKKRVLVDALTQMDDKTQLISQNLAKDNKALEDALNQLDQDNTTLTTQNTQLISQNQNLTKENTALKEDNKALEDAVVEVMNQNEAEGVEDKDVSYVEKLQPYEPTTGLSDKEKQIAKHKLEQMNEDKPVIQMKKGKEKPKPKRPSGLTAERIREIQSWFEVPLNEFYLDFDQLNDEERRLVDTLLPPYLQNRLSNTNLTQHLTIDFDLGDRWVRYNLGKPNILNKILEFIQHPENLALTLDENTIPKDYQYQNEFCLPPFSIIHKLQFRETRRSWTNQDEEVNTTNDRSGAFLEYLLPDYVSPEFEELMIRYQVFKTLQKGDGIRKELDDNCFIYALKRCGIPKDILDRMRLRVRTRYISKKSIYELCEEAKIGCEIAFPSAGRLKKAEKTESGKRNTNLGYKGDDQIGFIRLTCVNHHFFLYDTKIPISGYYIRNMKDINEFCIKNKKSIKDWGFKVVSRRGNGYKIDSRSNLSSYAIISTLFETNQMVPLKYSDLGIMTSDLYKYMKEEHQLDGFNEDICCKPITQIMNQRKEEKEHTYFYADFECSTVDDKGFPLRNHKPYCVSYSKRGEDKEENIWGYDCIQRFLHILPTESVVYFHNLGYDGRLLAPYGVQRSIIKGTKMYSLDLTFEGKIIHCKDSLALLQAPLSMFPKMFNLPDIEKEAMPYNLYTYSVIRNPKRVRIEGAWVKETKPWDKNKIEDFKKNIITSGSQIDSEFFDAQKYAAFYCNRDVEILRKGFEVFREKCLTTFHLDPDKYLTASSLANAFFLNTIYNPNGKMYLYSGVLRDYIRGAAYGGRCMTCENKSYHVKKELYDFDACSLYPSAMCRLWTVEGKPKMMSKDMLSVEYLLAHTFIDNQTTRKNDRYISAYVIDLEITKIGIQRKFPLILKKEKGLNVNCNECIHMRVDNITLEDLVNFQGISGTILNGVYWTGNRDYRCREIIHNAYTERAKLKKEGNPLEQVYKLILNSGYGKCIQKAIDKEIKWKKQGQDLDKFLHKNYYKIDKTFSVENSKIWGVEMIKQIDTFANNALFGIQVLSMSKRIMNEVMCLAEDIGCKMYYQDTDSIHIECTDLPKLEEEFKKKYHRDLVGKDTGQFHPDFPLIGSSSMPISVESYFIGKKTYCDKLIDSEGNVGYHLRMKGIPNETLWYVINTRYDSDPLKLYEDIFQDKKVVFDLCQDRVQFKMDKSMNIHSLDHMYRTITRPSEYKKEIVEK